MARISRPAAALAALALAVALPGAAFASTATSTTTATATVDAVISMTGVPATYAFPAKFPGQVADGPSSNVTITSSQTPFTLSAAATTFTSGGNSIPTSALTYHVGGNDTVAGASGVAVEVANSNIQLTSGTPFPVSMSLAIPGAAKSGSYTSTITWTASN